MGSKVNHKELSEQIKTAYETKTPLFIWGSVGIGKSSAVEQSARNFAKDLNTEFCSGEDNGKFGFIDVRISQLEPSDLRGLPMPDKDTGTTKWLIPSWLPKNKESRGILFFDELNLAPPSIQATAYQLILNRRIGDYRLPDGWSIISAGNRIDDICNVFEMSSALCNRFSHTELMTPDKDEWCSWGIENGIDGRILAFVQFKPSILFRFDSKMKDKAFPTPRSWEFCSNLIKGKEHGDMLEKYVASCVGEATSIEFNAFLKLQNKLDIKAILENPKLAQNIKELDLKFVLVGAVSEYYRKDKKVLEKSFELCNYIEPEYSILLLRFMKGVNQKHFTDTIITNKDGKALLSKYADILC